MPLEQLTALLVFAFAAAVTPGPNNTMLLASGVNYGFRRTLPHLLGINLGFPLMVLAIGLGLAQVFAAEPRLYTILKVVSIAYLLWLAWKIGSATPKTPDAPSTSDDGHESQPLTFLQAAAFQWVNPKGWIMGIGAFAAYAIPGRAVLSAIIISLAYVVVGFPSSAIWAGFGVGMRRFLGTPARVRAFNITMALLLVASLAPVAADLIRAI
ncbi:MAG: LysE family translocator [Hyphomicrobiaceae bacterium]